MDGTAGIIYAYIHASHLLQNDSLLEIALQLAAQITKDDIQCDRSFDLFSGNAGLGLIFYKLYAETCNNNFQRHAEECGEYLLQHKVKNEHGIFWPTLNSSRLTGFSHGTAGIAHSLLYLGYKLGREDFILAAQEALNDESLLFSKEQNNWPDYRQNSADFTSYNLCHGAPGIGLARLYSLHIFKSQSVHQDIENAIDATIHHLVSTVDHVCCGNTGLLIFLWKAANDLKRENLKQLVKEQTNLLFKRYLNEGNFRLYKNLPAEVQNPGFMKGLAGIGYFSLLLSNAEQKLPEVLALN